LNTSLKKSRQAKKLTQQKLAEQTGVAVRTYKYYESGARMPDVRTAQKIAAALGATVDELFPAG
jgi:transcriptional regulator with XRE-family HTH domain